MDRRTNMTDYPIDAEGAYNIRSGDCMSDSEIHAQGGNYSVQSNIVNDETQSDDSQMIITPVYHVSHQIVET